MLRTAVAVVAASALLAMGVASVSAAESPHGPITVEQPWSRASPGAAPNGAAYMTLRTTGGADRLVAVESPAAQRAELHTLEMAGTVMRMRPVDAIDVPAGGAVTLQPGGLHVMLMGLDKPLVEGETLPLTLVFEDAGRVAVSAQILGVGARGPGGQSGHGGHSGHGEMPDRQPAD